MIDIHCHLLPGIDDGPATMEDALALAFAVAADGVTHAVCTPHVYPGRFENRRSSIPEAYTAFAQALEQAGCPLQLGWAGEVRLMPEVLQLLDRGELPFLGLCEGFKTLLLEMPDGQIPLGAERLVQRLLMQKVRPVLVHPERNRAVMDNPERLELFVDMGCAVQVTAGSLCGHFGTRAQATAKRLLDEEWVTAVATDAHNLGGRKPRMGEASAWLAKHYGASEAHRLTVQGPQALSHANEWVNAA